MSRGHKTCPACSKEVGPRTKKCSCGYEFLFKTMLVREALASRKLDGETQETLPLPINRPENPLDVNLPMHPVGYKFESGSSHPQACVSDLATQGRGTPLATVKARIDEVRTFAQTLNSANVAWLRCLNSDKEEIILEIQAVEIKDEIR